MTFLNTFGNIFVYFIWAETVINEVVFGIVAFAFPNFQLLVKMFSSNYLFDAYGDCKPSIDGATNVCTTMDLQCRHQVNYFIRFEGMMLTAMGLTMLVGLKALSKLANQNTPKPIPLFNLPLFHLIIFALLIGDVMHIFSVVSMITSIHETMFGQTYISWFTAIYRFLYLFIYVVVPWLRGSYNCAKSD